MWLQAIESILISEIECFCLVQAGEQLHPKTPERSMIRPIQSAAFIKKIRDAAPIGLNECSLCLISAIIGLNLPELCWPE